MSRSGCSGRECHGSFSGQGGFQLSLFGYDFEKDHKAITQDDGGNEGEIRTRVDDPKNSLILTKPTMQVKHRGKERIKKDSWEYNLILKWIQGGAKFDLQETGEFDRLEVFPARDRFQEGRRQGSAQGLRLLEGRHGGGRDPDYPFPHQRRIGRRSR